MRKFRIRRIVMAYPNCHMMEQDNRARLDICHEENRNKLTMSCLWVRGRIVINNQLQINAILFMVERKAMKYSFLMAFQLVGLVSNGTALSLLHVSCKQIMRRSPGNL